MEMRRFGDLSGPFIAPARGGIASSLILLLHGWGADGNDLANLCLLYTSPSPRDMRRSRMPSSA